MPGPPPLGIREFDLHQMMPGANIVVIGPKFSGKSNLIMSILLHMSRHWFDGKGFDYAMAMSATENNAQEFRQHMPEILVEQLSKTRLSAVLAGVQEQYGKDMTDNRPFRHSLLLLDDCAYDETFMKSKEIKDIASNGRQYNVTAIIAAQRYVQMPTALRDNVDFVFLFYIVKAPVKKALYSEWFSHMPPDVFTRIYEEVTKEFACIVLDRRRMQALREWRESVFWFKAPLALTLPPFQVVSQDMQEVCKYCTMTGQPGASNSGVVKLSRSGDVL